MKKFLYVLLILFTIQNVYAESVFESNQKATEVKLSPAINTTKTQTTDTNATYKTSLKEQKFNSALINLDDAQVELREELSTVTAQYNDALVVKKNAIQNCKNIKKELNAINKKMNNIEKSKKIIRKNMELENKK